MPARAPAEEGSLLPRGFPTVADLAECESAEEKAELCDKADLLVERLEAKADSAEAFVDGPICAFFGFLKPNAIRNAEKARAAAEEAAAAAAALRRAAAGGPGGGVIAGAVAALVAAGAAAVVLGGGGGGGEPLVKKSEPRASRTPTERVVKQPKERVAKASTGQAFTLFSAPEPKAETGLYGLEASNMAEKVTKGEVDALSAYEALQRK
ncbi:predicted protein [Micromonas commoda]|uniref:Uncharacterized protein n=1 Tax=Micromonas commoda (strain RCC299 / NOUM17 / CCMP2709) TaxID=296587 RepID=C1E6Q2_MICCC|nr:predicted protein [Micromonas commoda]ACO63843.1 predicted protein [Micromonas commoda]|eukprot:XP_002502585.1 predicted protein [Micromonas commoda]